MTYSLGETLTPAKINNLEQLTTHGSYSIYWVNEDPPQYMALDSNGLVCSLFQFIEGMNYEDNGRYQLCHMHTLPSHKGRGLGKEIMRRAVATLDCFELPSTNHHDNCYYVEDGLGFILRCFRYRILTEPPFKRPQ